MIPRRLRNRLQSLTDALIHQEGVEAAFLASVLLAASDAVNDGETAAFAMRVWHANHPPKAEPAPAPASLPQTPKRPSRRRRAG